MHGYGVIYRGMKTSATIPPVDTSCPADQDCSMQCLVLGKNTGVSSPFPTWIAPFNTMKTCNQEENVLVSESLIFLSPATKECGFLPSSFHGQTRTRTIPCVGSDAS